MTPAPDDLDWAMGELFHLIAQAKELNSVAWRVDWDWFWACMRVVYAQDQLEQQRLLRMLTQAIGKRSEVFRFFADAYARAD